MKVRALIATVVKPLGVRPPGYRRRAPGPSDARRRRLARGARRLPGRRSGPTRRSCARPRRDRREEHALRVALEQLSGRRSRGRHGRPDRRRRARDAADRGRRPPRASPSRTCSSPTPTPTTSPRPTRTPSRFDLQVLAHPIEAERMDRRRRHARRRRRGHAPAISTITALLTPGHSPGHLSFLVNGTDCFTADVLFHGTVGGTMRDSYESLHHSIMDVLMKLPPETRVHPGHTDPTTIGAEWEENVFVRLWRGVDPVGAEPCTVNDRAATLELFAPDYDGGHKGLVRWEDGSHDVVPGSRVVKGAAPMTENTALTMPLSRSRKISMLVHHDPAVRRPGRGGDAALERGRRLDRPRPVPRALRHLRASGSRSATTAC